MLQQFTRSPRDAALAALPWKPSQLARRHHDRISLKSAWVRAKKLQARYSSRLRQVAQVVDHLVKGFDASTTVGQGLIQSALLRYKDVLQPWAEATADAFVKEVAAADREAWRRNSAEIGRAIIKEIDAAPMAAVFDKLKREQVDLITSLPQQASERVADRVKVGIAQGLRAEQVAKEIYETGAVTKSRAATIALTETSRAAVTFQAARAQSVGSTQFRWVTSGDHDVRPSHKKLNGTVHRWDAPPLCDAPNYHALPGGIWRCRCIAVPIFD